MRIINSGIDADGVFHIIQDNTASREIDVYVNTAEELDALHFEGGIRKRHQWSEWPNPVQSETLPEYKFNWNKDPVNLKVVAYLSADETRTLLPGQYTYSLQYTNDADNSKRTIEAGDLIIHRDPGGWDTH